MYLWVGIDVDSQLQIIKKTAEAIEKQIGFENSNFTLPLHISLKISFPILDSQYEEVLNDIIGIYSEVQPFNIDIIGINLETNICWIRMKNNRFLQELQKELNNMLLTKHGIKLHEYDLDYLFHTTLFMDNDLEKVAKAYQFIKETNIPKELIANRFLIGMSPEGKLGTYKVIKEIIK